MTEHSAPAPKSPAPAGKPGEAGTATGTGKVPAGQHAPQQPAQGGQQGK